MDGSSVNFIVMPIVIPLVLFAGIALPYIADAAPRLSALGSATTAFRAVAKIFRRTAAR